MSTNDLKTQSKKTYLYYSLLFFLFCTCYACLTYNTAYYLEIGLSNTMIGLIQSFNSIASFIVPPIMGILADKMRSTRKALRICILFNIFAFVAMPNLRGFLPLLALTSVFSGTRNAADSLSMTWVVSELELAKKRGIHIPYGSVRVWGSAGYSLFCILLNLAMDKLGLSVRGSFYVGAVSMAAMLLFLLLDIGHAKQEPAAADSIAKPKPLTLKELRPRRLLHNYYYLTYLLTYVLLWMASCFDLNYTTNLLQEIGVSTAFLGTVSGIRAICEIPGLFFSGRMAKKFGYEKCLIASGIAFTLESFLFMNAQGPLAVLAAQAIHGVFDGMFMGLYGTYLFKLIPHSLAATTQTFNMAAANIAAMVFYLLGGSIVDRLGVRTVYWLAAAIPAVGIVWFLVTLWIGRIRRIPRYDPENDPIEQAILHHE